MVLTLSYMFCRQSEVLLNELFRKYTRMIEETGQRNHNLSEKTFDKGPRLKRFGGEKYTVIRLITVGNIILL